MARFGRASCFEIPAGNAQVHSTEDVPATRLHTLDGVATDSLEFEAYLFALELVSCISHLAGKLHRETF